MNRIYYKVTNLAYFLLALIVLFSFIIRIYKIDSAPPSLTWDEAAVGYNAWTIANYVQDEYGKVLPFYFRSFGEDKQPIHIYITALFVKLFGLSEFSTRIPAAFFGALNVLLIFFLAKDLLNNNLIGLLSSFFLAASPQNIHFSRFNHEANFALFFFMLGILLFFQSVKKRKNLLPFSFLFFILSIFSYNAAKIAVPPIILLLIILYFKELKLDKLNLFIIGTMSVGVILLIILQPGLVGINRLNQTIQGRKDFEKTPLFEITQNLFLGRINLALIQYSWHFDPNFLFISGDKNSRLSSQGAGEFYKIDIPFLIMGVLYLIIKKSKQGIFLLWWALVGPLPSSLVAEAPHAGRTAFMMGSWHIISALGFYTLMNLFRKSFLKWVVISLCLTVLLFSLYGYLNNYFNEFSKRYAIDWQYGMRQIVEYVRDHQLEYNQVYTTAIRSQPYIFFLYYLKTPLPDFLNTVIYNNAQDQNSNNVSSFGKYFFGGWNPIESAADKGVLYVLSPSEYDGLVNRSDFDIKQIIHYPNGSTAFYLVTRK